MSFAKSDQVERYLTQLGADWKYRDSIPIAKLNSGWSDQNPCRAGRAIIDAALSYAERMSDGSPAPPAIVVKSPSGYVLLDGRQRVFAAHTNGASVFSAYELISPSPRMEQLVALGANQALNGVRPSIDFIVDAAIKFMESHNATETEAARIAGVTTQTIKEHIATRRVRDALLSRQVEPQLANGVLAALEEFIPEPAYLVNAYQAIEKAGATVPMAKALANEMRKQPGKGRQLAIDRWLDRPEIVARIANKMGRKMQAKERVFQKARALKTVLKESFDEIGSELKDNDRKELAKLGTYINGKIRQLAGEFVTVPA